ncbi:hypothetical protein D3C81_2162100 [compost metagenome]|jgi:DNA-directed RNA polymerase subunit RPC12/RpoP
MNLYKCGVCDTEIPFISLKCPECGKYRLIKRKPTKTGWIITVAIFIVIIVAYITDILI